MHVCRGNFDPFMIISARQKMKAELTVGAPPVTNFTRNMGQRMKLDDFVEDFDIFY
jgi:hypothetical protein